MTWPTWQWHLSVLLALEVYSHGMKFQNRMSDRLRLHRSTRRHFGGRLYTFNDVGYQDGLLPLLRSTPPSVP